MKKLTGLFLLFVFTVSAPAIAGDKDSSLEKALKDVVSEDEHPGKGKGRPDNPGEHGRANAAEKQSRGHGNGSKKVESWEDKVRDEIESDDKDKNKNKNKNKNK